MLLKVNPLAIPADPEQAAMFWTALNDKVKNMLNSGEIQDFGMYADGSGGYMLWDDKGKTESDMIGTLTGCLGLMPFATCDARPILNVDQARATIKQS